MRRMLISAVAATPLLLALASPPPETAWPDVEAQVSAARAAMVSSPESALAAALGAMRTAHAKPPSPARDKAEAVAGWLEGEALTRVNRASDALPVLEAALKQAQAVAPDTKLEGDLLKARGWSYSARGDVQSALIDFQKAHDIYVIRSDARGEAISLRDVGEIYIKAYDYKHAILYFKQSIRAYNGDVLLLIDTYNGLGGSYLGLADFSHALTVFKSAERLARMSRVNSTLAQVLMNKAEAQVRLGLFSDAQASILEAFHLAASDPAARVWTPMIWSTSAQLDLRRGRLAEARSAVQHAFDGQDLERTPAQFREAHETAWKVYAALGRPDLALPHLVAFKRLDDQDRELAASTNAALIGAKFDFANQDLRIARLRAEELRKDVALARSRARAQATLLTTVSAAALLVIALVLAGFFAMRRSRNAVRHANARLEQTNTALQRALKAKSQFLATTSHEIRTPLNGILGMTQVMLTDRTLPPATRGRVELVHGAGETMRALVDDLLDLAKMETERIDVAKRPLDLPQLINDTVRLWRAEAGAKGLTLTLDAPDPPPWILEDEARLRQVLFNLMSNAIKFTDRGGVTLRIARDGGELLFAVTDTGIGVAPEDQARVFEAFTQIDGGTTRRHGGTGLGLAICRDVAHALGGEVTLESRLGEGSTFTLRLPLAEAEKAPNAAEGRARVRTGVLAEARLLVVEPNPLARSVLRAVLAPACSGVEAAADGAAAEAALARGAFDHLVIAGEALGDDPDAAAGELAKLLSAAAGAGVTALLTRPSPEMTAAVEKAGRAPPLLRPVSPEALLAAVRDALTAAAGAEGGLQAAA